MQNAIRPPVLRKRNYHNRTEETKEQKERRTHLLLVIREDVIEVFLLAQLGHSVLGEYCAFHLDLAREAPFHGIQVLPTRRLFACVEIGIYP